MSFVKRMKGYGAAGAYLRRGGPLRYTLPALTPVARNYARSWRSGSWMLGFLPTMVGGRPGVLFVMGVDEIP